MSNLDASEWPNGSVKSVFELGDLRLWREAGAEGRHLQGWQSSAYSVTILPDCDSFQGEVQTESNESWVDPVLGFAQQ